MHQPKITKALFQPTSNMTLHIDAQGDMLFSVGENQTYTGVVTFPAGVAVTNLQVWTGGLACNSTGAWV